MVAVAVTLAFSFFLERQDGLGDAALALQARTFPRNVPPRVKVVRIDDEDYARLFGARSPMDPQAVMNVIRAIAAGGPSVIGVDVETTDPAYARLPDRVAGVPIVWARAFRCLHEGVDVPACPAPERVPQPAAGRADPDSARTGLVMLPQERDGSVRRYARVVTTRDGDLPAFTTAILREAGISVKAENSGTSRLIRYRGVATADSLVTARWVLGASAGPRFAADGVFSGRIVLFGGSFWAGRDHHVTPVGDLAGVQVLAQILETELDGGGLPPPRAWHFFLIQCLAGFGIVAIFHRRELQPALALSLALCAVTAPLSSLFVFGTWKLWFYFLPVLGAWLVQQLYDEAKGYRDELLLGTRDTARPAPPTLAPPATTASAPTAPPPPPPSAEEKRKQPADPTAASPKKPNRRERSKRGERRPK